MAKLSTMGTSSCATIAIQGFKEIYKVYSAVDLNEAYLNNTDGKSPDKLNSAQKAVQKFYNGILYPTEQKLGRTRDYPFDALMKAIDESSMNDKFTIITLNEYQKNYKDNYWENRLKFWGFELMDKTKNNIGDMCYIYVRNLARPKNVDEVVYKKVF